MLYLESIPEPLSEWNVNIQLAIINSGPEFNQIVLGKRGKERFEKNQYLN